MYCEVRTQLMMPVVQQRCKEYGTGNVVGLVRNGCAYMIQVCFGCAMILVLHGIAFV